MRSAVVKRSTRGEPSSPSGEHDLQGTGVGGPGEHVVGLDELVEVEVVGDELAGVELAARSISFSSVGVE